MNQIYTISYGSTRERLTGKKKMTEIDSHLNQHNIVGEIIFSDEFELNDVNPSRRITVIYHQLLMWKKLSTEQLLHCIFNLCLYI